MDYDEDDDQGAVVRDDSLDEDTKERIVAGARWNVRAEVDKVWGLLTHRDVRSLRGHQASAIV